MPYSAWVEQRRNLFANPRAVSSTNFTSSAGQATVSYTGSAVRYTFDANVAANLGLNQGAFVADQQYRILVRARANKNILARLRVKGGLGPQVTITTEWQWFDATVTATASGSSVQNGFLVSAGAGQAAGDWVEMDRVLLAGGTDTGPWFSGADPDPSDLEDFTWVGTADASQSVYRIRTYTPPAPITPVKNITTEDVLYGDRVTSYRWEVLEHTNGVDQLVGTLDGVADGQITWTQNVQVKGGGRASVVDLEAAAAGLLRIADLKLESVRLRPVCIIQGLPENPLGVFLVTAAAENWEATGRVWSLELLDKCTVPAQDLVDQSYAVPAGALILQTVKSILASCGEYIAINESVTLATSTGMVWEAGTSKLKIINDLLDVAGYNALWMDGYGNFMVTPRVLPADRSILYEVLGVARELRDGAQSIYEPTWNRQRDSFEVPNKVIAVQAAGGEDTAALVGQWTNEDPASPYSYVARGRWITYVLDSVETPEGTEAETIAFLQQRARTTLIQMSAVQAQVKVTHLPIPVRVSDVLRFSHTQAGVDARHVVVRISLDTSPLGLMSSELQEVISL